MSDAFKCDRCDEYEDGTPYRLEHNGEKDDSAYVKEFCHRCYMGWIEYITGEPASEINEWDAFKVER